MKIIYQNYKDGIVQLAEVPEPALQPGGVLVRNVASLVSAGTEKLMVDLAQKSLLGKAMETASGHRARVDISGVGADEP